MRLKVAAVDVGLRLSWTPRVRVHGDSWDRDAVAVDRMRFRVRVLDRDDTRRVTEVEGQTWVYAATMMAEDFPDGVAGPVSIAVAQWSDGYGWGSEGVVAVQGSLIRGGGLSG
ncbi:MAG: hypothetical protein DCE92_09660 [Alphaproteobacteria bacterium]|nr:MAG: hypothetical protein DCE92_09660 [Alphaproteobacteria bacterium]